jgi:hypothetical protein
MFSFFYNEGILKIKLPLTFFLVTGRLDQRDEIFRFMRSINAIGTLYFDFNAQVT